MTMMFNERIPFSAVFSLRRGLNITRADYRDVGVPCLSYGDVHSRYLGFVDSEVQPLPKVSDIFFQTDPNCLVSSGEFVFADTSEDYDGVGNCTCVLNVGQGLFAGYHTIVASPTKKQICSRYYGYYFLSDDFRTQVRKEVSGIKVFSITNSILNATRILFPDLNIQKKIANFLDHKLSYIDSLIAQKNDQLVRLSEYRQALITRAVTKGVEPNISLKDSGIVCLGQIPASWTLPKVIHVLAMPITDGPHETPTFQKEGIPFISAEAVSKGEIDFEKKRGYISPEYYEECCKKYIPQMGDIYIIKSGATTGNSAMVVTDDVFQIWSPLAVLRANNEVILPKFLFYVVKSQYFIREIQDNWSFGTQQNIGMRALEKLVIALPSASEQEAIVSFLDERCSYIDGISSKLQKTISLLKEYRSSLISAAVTGKLNINEVENVA